MRKILITGGSGFIGTHLINSLVLNASTKDNLEIVNIDIASSSIVHECVEHLNADIRDTNKLFELLKNRKFDTCVHLAALCKEPGFDWHEYFETNLEGTKNIISICKELAVYNIYFTSTMMVYKAGEFVRDEDDMTDPDTAYGISKLLAEKELEKWQLLKANRNLKIIRPAVVFGENENGNFTRLYRSLARGFFPYVGKSSTVKSSIYVLELIEFIKFLMDKPTQNHIFNFSFPAVLTLKQTIGVFKKTFRLKTFNPVLPYSLLLIASYFFELLNAIGVKNSIHHRRIQKLYYSTNIHPKNALDDGYTFKYDLASSLEHWKSTDSLLN